MDHDDDVEHLFSWLQTPELRYREFAGAREITDSVVIVQQQRGDNTPVPQDEPIDAPYHDARLDEEYPEDEFPDQGETRAEMLPEAPPAAREDTSVGEVGGVGRGPLTIAPVPMSGEPSDPAANAGLFTLGAGGRGPVRSGPAEWAGPRPPLIQTPALRQASTPTPAAVPQPIPQGRPASPTSGGGLLGGAYRENGADGHGSGGGEQPQSSSQNSEQRDQHSLDAVFGRLAGGRRRLPDPRERLRHGPGLGPPAGRPR